MQQRMAASLLDDLNEQQRRAVTHTGGPLLVIAGPGSGKTRVITYRAAWLVRERNVPPEHILAVTFTNRAAEEMRARLHHLLGEQADAMWVHTFHAVALRLLRRYGTTIGLPEDFAVADEETQRAILADVVQRLGLSLEAHPPYALADFIGKRKAALLDPTQPAAADAAPPAWLDVARAYQDVLAAQRLLDFDDLIERAVHLLRAHPTVRERVQRTLTHVLVDEYQDINRAQFTLLTLLAPPDGEITAVADEDQSIYGWRGADPYLVDRFVRHYNPTTVSLTLSYRSRGHILYAAQRFVARRRLREKQSFLRTVHDMGEPIYHYIFQSLDQEQQWLVRVIHGLVAERGYRYRDIAVLYRTHALADPLEQALLQAGIPVQRVRPRDPMDHDALQDIVRYLALLHVPSEYDYVHVLHFPTPLVDEPTQARIERLAREAGVTLGHVAQHPEAFPALGPLTRWQLRRFREDVAHLREQVADLALPVLVSRLFELLARRRSPFTREEHHLLRGFQRAVPLDAWLRPLVAAVRSGRPVHLALAPGAETSLDAWAAWHILRHALEHVLDVPSAPEAGAPALTVRISATPALLPVTPESEDALTLAPVDAGSLTYPVSVVAWRLAGELLVSLDSEDAPYVVYDLETTGTNPRRDEVVEIAAQRYRNGRAVGAPFYTLVRPTRRNFIPRAASAVHGITWQDVADAPTLAEALPAFLDYIGEETLVGHNVRRFDNRFLDRALDEHLGRGLSNPTVDTLEMARRLFPEERQHTLEHMSRVLNVLEGQAHRAAADVVQTAAVYHALLAENRARRAREALPEALPLVAVGLLDAAAPLVDEHRALLHAALRVLRRFPQQPLLDALVAGVDESLQWRALDHLARLRDMDVPEDEEDARWAQWHDHFQDVVARYLQAGGHPTLADFLDYQALRTAADQVDPDLDAVTLMTLHNAKGTEFPVVIIAGLEEGTLPLWTTREDEQARNEERRVFYVGMTRARERLYLTSVVDRKEGIQRRPSPFAFELDERHVRRFQVDRRGRVREIT